jgi:energy-coupling factor transporter transmembrane protein EcfT|tara:strand:+ start:86 stop:298 length:213 start_codon:yes stop_codon:yes gene_type:complete
MDKIIKKLALISHWLCFAIGIAVLVAISFFSADLGGLFNVMALIFALTSILVGAAIRWMFSGQFHLLPWK